MHTSPTPEGQQEQGVRERQQFAAAWRQIGFYVLPLDVIAFHVFCDWNTFAIQEQQLQRDYLAK